MKRRVRYALLATIAMTTMLVVSGVAWPQGAVDTGSVANVAPEDYFEVKDDAHYDISFRQASLREVLQFLSWIADANVIIPEGLEGVVNVSFKDITLSGALNSIIKANNVEYTVENGIVRIGRREQFRESGEDLKTETFRLRFALAREMADRSKTLLSSRGSAIADERTNSLIVRDLPANIENVRRFINDVDIKDAQVLIESKIMETTRRFARALGIQWGLNKTSGNVQFGGLTAVGQADSGRNLNVNMAPAAAPSSGLLISALFKGVNLDAQLLAAEDRGDAYVISDPSIVTSNGKAANIRSGSTILVQGTSTTNGTTTSTGVQEIQTGVELKVTPQITLHDFVKLDIEATTSTPDFSHTVQGIPIIVDNVARTSVLVKDGESTVIGGLSRFSDSLQKQSVPYLSKIPVLGNLFKSKERNVDNTELMVFIKPSIVRSDGQEPVQMRVREVEERRAAMYLDPILIPETEKLRVGKEIKEQKGRRGNKYVK